MNLAATNPNMGLVGFGLTDAQTLITHILNLLETSGDTMKDTILTLLKLCEYVTSRNLSGIISSLMALGANFKQIAADFRAEFGL